MRDLRWSELGTMDSALKQAIREGRDAVDMTQEQAAENAGMCATSKWSELERERGRSKPLSLMEIQQCAEAVGTTGATLIRRANEIASAAK